jgi:hypothetical protein
MLGGVLIEPDSPWPPPGHAHLRARWQSWRAWWSGDPAQLKQHTACTAPGGYWARRAAKPGGREMHLPLAADLARTSAELVCGDTPVMEWETEAETTAWDELSQMLGWANSLLEAGETEAALGGVLLRPAWDSETAEHPFLTVVPVDEALPEFRFGVLQSVTFVEELPAPAGWKALERGEVWRHLEHHESGQIRHELWLGNTSSVGHSVNLTEHPATKFLTGEINTRSVRPGLLVEHIPYGLPNPLVRLPLGRSAFQGIESLLDAIDEVWDSWMRDIRLGKGRIMLSKEMLDPVTASSSSGLFGRRGNTTPAAAFDADAEAFVKLETPSEEGGKSTPITVVQFAIRFQEHAETLAALVEQCCQRAGFAPQTLGINVDGQLSGTAMRRREQRSYRTRDRARRYMRPALERCAETLMLLNAELFGGPKPTKRPTLQWRETDQADPKEAAEVIDLLRRAQAASTEVLVGMAHPEWDGDQVDEEVGRIAVERAADLAPVLADDEFEPDTEQASGAGITAEQANTFGTLVRSGVEPQDAARQAGIGTVQMIPGATPVTINLPEDDDAPPVVQPAPRV